MKERDLCLYCPVLMIVEEGSFSSDKLTFIFHNCGVHNMIRIVFISIVNLNGLFRNIVPLILSLSILLVNLLSSEFYRWG